MRTAASPVVDPVVGTAASPVVGPVVRTAAGPALPVCYVAISIIIISLLL